MGNALVLGDEFPQWPHVGDNLLRDGVNTVLKSNVAGQSEAHACGGIALGTVGRSVTAGFGGALADRCPGGSVYWHADTDCTSICARSSWSAQDLWKIISLNFSQFWV